MAYGNRSYRSFAPRSSGARADAPRRSFAPAAPIERVAFVEHPASAQQETIYASAVADRQSELWIARAGTGKTYSMVAAMYRMLRKNPNLRLGACAYNKPIGDELQTKVPEGVPAGTTHSFGRKIIAAHNGGRVFVDKDKTEKMLPPNMDQTTKTAIVKVVSMCKAHLCDGRDRNRVLDLAAQYEIDLGDDPQAVLEWTPDCLKQARDRTTVIDFDDMIWLPVVLNMHVDRLDVLFVDEAQDLNPAQHAFVLMLADRLILVGDDRQAINHFRGADSASLDTMRDKLGALARGVKTLFLTVTFRCRPMIVELAQSLVPDYECDPAAWAAYQQAKAEFATHLVTDGRFGPDPTFYGAYGDTYGHICREAHDTCTPHPGDLVVCRTNAPNISLAYRLIQTHTPEFPQGVPVKIQGREIGQGLVGRIKRLVGTGSSVSLLLQKLHEYRDKETAKITAANGGERAADKLQTLADQCDCIEALCDGMDTVQDVIARVDTLFANVAKGDASKYVLLSSVHRAKGLEADRVFVQRPDQMPHPMARSAEAKAQELNLMYVAWTRAKRELHLH